MARYTGTRALGVEVPRLLTGTGTDVDDVVRPGVVLEAGGRETRGNGTAKALVTCGLSGSGENSTDVFVDTDLAITGKPTQFGRGTLAEVAGVLTGQFGENLVAEPAATAPQVAPAPETAVARPVEGSAAPPVDTSSTRSARAPSSASRRPPSHSRCCSLLVFALRDRRRTDR
ncbi:hypothetical protein [Streptomyces sp. NPDC091215]|uniref:hypothetical protein n=1 Tax=Streptomyces sp. NPDC091215 TaxID=3155192 RepID=UPI00341723C8